VIEVAATDVPEVVPRTRTVSPTATPLRGMDRVTDTVLEVLTATDADVPFDWVTVIVDPSFDATVPCTTVPAAPPAVPVPGRLVPPAPKPPPLGPVVA
jgi:hypothetical protein